MKKEIPTFIYDMLVDEGLIMSQNSHVGLGANLKVGDPYGTGTIKFPNVMPAIGQKADLYIDHNKIVVLNVTKQVHANFRENFIPPKGTEYFDFPCQNGLRIGFRITAQIAQMSSGVKAATLYRAACYLLSNFHKL